MADTVDDLWSQVLLCAHKGIRARVRDGDQLDLLRRAHLRGALMSHPTKNDIRCCSTPPKIHTVHGGFSCSEGIALRCSTLR